VSNLRHGVQLLVLISRSPVLPSVAVPGATRNLAGALKRVAGDWVGESKCLVLQSTAESYLRKDGSLATW